MAMAGSFKVPSMVPQDLAIVMGFIDPPAPAPHSKEKRKLMRGQKRNGSPNIASKFTIDTDTDISSSCAESEDEVEAQIVAPLASDSPAIVNAMQSSATALSSHEDSGSDSDTSKSSASRTSFQPQRTQRQRSVVDFDAFNDDDSPKAVTYIPTAHEIPPSSIPVLSLPDPSTLPQEMLELVGKIVAILPDSVTVCGSSLSNSSARERRDAVLNEGSLLLLDDRTPLGYVTETFGPTTLPHYLVRIKSPESTGTTTSLSLLSPDDSSEPATDHNVSDAENNLQPTASLISPPTPLHRDCIDPTKIVVSRAVFHIPSLSNFVFPSTLARVKGSDASNFHDEEVGEFEQDFSDDEAEARHKRFRRRSPSPSATLGSSTFDDEADSAISVASDPAGSLYGASPYDVEDISTQSNWRDGLPASPSASDCPTTAESLITFEDPDVQDALMLARNSRQRKHTFISTSEPSSATGPSRDQDHQPPGRGKRGGRGRWRDRGRSERGRERNSRGQVRDRGHRRGPGVTPNVHDGEHMLSGNRRSSFSFEEYDPHMPRPPSPTSLAIARATGQWADGTPFPYTFGATSDVSAAGAETHIAQTSRNVQDQMSMSHSLGLYASQGYYDSTIAIPQTLGYQPLHVGNYGIAPHINPRFAQTLSLPNAAQESSLTPQKGSVDVPIPYLQTEPPASEAESVFQSED